MLGHHPLARPLLLLPLLPPRPRQRPLLSRPPQPGVPPLQQLAEGGLDEKGRADGHPGEQREDGAGQVEPLLEGVGDQPAEGAAGDDHPAVPGEISERDLQQARGGGEDDEGAEAAADGRRRSLPAHPPPPGGEEEEGDDGGGEADQGDADGGDLGTERTDEVGDAGRGGGRPAEKAGVEGVVGGEAEAQEQGDAEQDEPQQLASLLGREAAPGDADLLGRFGGRYGHGTGSLGAGGDDVGAGSGRTRPGDLKWGLIVWHISTDEV